MESLRLSSLQQTGAPFPHAKLNLTNPKALEKPKRIKKKLFSKKTQGFKKHRHKSHEIPNQS